MSEGNSSASETVSPLENRGLRRIPPWKRVVFSLMPLVLLLAGTEIALRLADFRFASHYLDDSIFEPGPDGTMHTAKMFTVTQPYRYAFSVPQQFKVTKEADSLRIVMVGGSSVVHLKTAPLMAAQLREHLHRPVEIINAGFRGCGSTRILLSVEEAMRYSPDILIVYGGHNEFISYFNPATLTDEKLRPKTKLEPRAIDLRLFQFLDRARFQLAPPQRKKIEGLSRLYEPEEKEPFYRQFRVNLEKIVDLAREHEVQVILGTLAYNYAVPPARAEGFEVLSELSDYSTESLESMAKERPGNAMIEFELGRRAYNGGDYPEAKRLLDLALLNDQRPHRATTRTNEIIREVARGKQVPLADVYEAVGSQFTYGITDGALFEDHCHLNEPGKAILQQVFAETVINTLTKSKATAPPPKNQ